MRKSQQALLLDNGNDPQTAGSESYSSNSSFTDSYSDSSDLANWEEFVANDGTLFYAEYLPHATGSSQDNRRVEFTRSSSLRMGKKARRQQQQQQKVAGAQKQPEFRFSNIKSHDDHFKQLELVITAADRFRFGRRSTAVESILGFRVVPFSDQAECLMVDGFVHDMPAMQQTDNSSSIKRGDWFKSLNDIDIRTSNVDELLLQFIQPTQVVLKFQGPPEQGEGGSASVGAAADRQNLQKVTNFDCFAEVFKKLHVSAVIEGKEEKPTPEIKVESTHLPFAMLIIPPECYQQDEHKNSMFYYPEDTSVNFLYKARGSFLTLNAVLTEELQTKPLLSQLLVENVQYFVSYHSLNGFLILFAFCAHYQTMKETSLRADELMTYIKFAFPTLSLDNFANSNAEAAAILRKFLYNVSTVQHVRVLAAHQKHQCLFEELFKESRYMPLPKEAQLRIFDALSEMEAMDYRNWNDEPLNTHREFFIHGSVLYYNHFMLASQLPIEARANVESFLRCRGIFDFVAEHSVRELYVWQEIMLPDASGRYFLCICCRSHLILAVILKIFDAPNLTAPDTTVSPSLFYIEEIQETLDHLIQCGIESLAMFWSVSNKRPEVLEKMEPPEANAEKEAGKFETFLKQKLTPSSSAAGPSGSQRSASYDEEVHLCSSLGGSSIHSLTPSEDDSSKKRSNANAEESDSGSDWEGFTEQNPLHYSDCDGQAQMTESLWKEINNVMPVNVTPGWNNSLYYYVYVDSTNGTILCPMKVNHEQFPYMREMRLACHTIHDVLQRTKIFRRQLSQESSKPSSGKVAIKEHGVSVVVREKNKEDGSKGAVRARFAVVGRLFFSPAREVYICHRPDVPQNMVEMAFRLSFFTVG